MKNRKLLKIAWWDQQVKIKLPEKTLIEKERERKREIEWDGFRFRDTKVIKKQVKIQIEKKRERVQQKKETRRESEQSKSQ